MTRDERLYRAKERALAYIAAGDLPRAVTSIVCDLGPCDREVLVGAQLLRKGAPAAKVREWIEAFR